MKIAEGIFMLKAEANVMGARSIIYPTLICDRKDSSDITNDDAVILVDTGFPGQLPKIREAIENEGISFDKLNMIIFTHQDIDHIGTASVLQKELPGRVKILCHEIEKPYINGEEQPVKLAQLESGLSNLPDSIKATYDKMKAGFLSSRIVIDETLTDGQELPYCGGIVVIHTPGHTPGHMCLYIKKHKLLIAGDILRVEEGKLTKAPDNINFDNQLNVESLKKLANYDIETVISYHRGLFEGNASQQIAKLAAQ